MPHAKYIPGSHWNSVALMIRTRRNKNSIAGDDEPYYRYKRKKFLRVLNALPFENKIVLEVGSGPGGNLLEINKHHPQKLMGVDISEEMISLSKEVLNDDTEVIKINGQDLPFENRSFDIVFTSSVLQHIIDENIFISLVSEICRVSSNDVYIFERIEKKRKVAGSNIGRTVEEYLQVCERNGFLVQEIKFLNIHWSWLICGAIRKIFNPYKRKEGEKQTRVSQFLQQVCLVLTKPMDELVPVKRELAMLHFKRNNPVR